MKSPIQPSLFDLVSSYADDIAAGAVDASRPLLKTTPIIVFCENFYLQFFESLGRPIVSVDDTSKRAAVELATELERQEGSRETVSLVQWFEEFCDLYPDVLAMGYGGSRVVFASFHTRYVPRLLDRADAWSRARTSSNFRFRSNGQPVVTRLPYPSCRASDARQQGHR